MYPEMSDESTMRLHRLVGKKRLVAEAILEAIRLAEEVEFRSPLPCEAKLAALEIKLRMELMLILELGIAPPSFAPYPRLLHYANGPEAQQVRERIWKTLRREFESLKEQERACKPYKGTKSAEAFFHQLIDESGFEECRRLTWIIGYDIEAVYGNTIDQGPRELIDYFDVQPGPDH